MLVENISEPPSFNSFAPLKKKIARLLNKCGFIVKGSPPPPPQHEVRWCPFIHLDGGMERGTVRVKGLAQEHNTVSSVGAQTR